jgi:hypothetical protein
MKKFFMAIVLCLVCTFSFGQKTFSSENFVVETVNEFGEKNGEIKVGILANGYFSNSATTNSCAKLMISIMEGNSWFSLYEYCGNHASHDDFRVTFIGTKTKKEVSTINKIPIEFIKLCNENDTINVKMYETDSYGSTTAVFRLFNCKDFYKKYVKQFGDELLNFDENYYRNKKPIILPLVTAPNNKITVFDLVPYHDNYIHINKYNEERKGYFYYKSYKTTDETASFSIDTPGMYEIEVMTPYNSKKVTAYIKN